VPYQDGLGRAGAVVCVRVGAGGLGRARAGRRGHQRLIVFLVDLEVLHGKDLAIVVVDHRDPACRRRIEARAAADMWAGAAAGQPHRSRPLRSAGPCGTPGAAACR
jgi:hypothetical protein